jgi:hypothetical protein
VIIFSLATNNKKEKRKKMFCYMELSSIYSTHDTCPIEIMANKSEEEEIKNKC